MRPAGAKVLRFDAPAGARAAVAPWSCSAAQVQRVQRVVVAASPQFITALRRLARFARKTVKPRLRRDGNAPLLSPAATSPPEGEILATLIFEFLMRTKDEWQEDFPLRGGKGTGFVGSRRQPRIQ